MDKRKTSDEGFRQRSSRGKEEEDERTDKSQKEGERLLSSCSLTNCEAHVESDGGTKKYILLVRGGNGTC